MASLKRLVLTAFAPVIWGTTYVVTTELLPEDHPLTVAVLRALPAGVLLLIIAPGLPRGAYLWRSMVLGALNFSIFWWLLFVSAYALPGGIAATVGAVQPILVLYFAHVILGQNITASAVVAGFGGVLGISLLVLQPNFALSPMGLLAALGGAVSMALGVVLSKRWQPDVPILTFTAWQLFWGGLFLLPAALMFEFPTAAFDRSAILGMGYLTLVGGALTYVLWFKGIETLGPSRVAPLGLLSPVTAVIVGWGYLGQSMTLLQITGLIIVLFSIWWSSRTT